MKLLRLKRVIALFSLAPLAAGCSSEGSSDWGALLSATRTYLENRSGAAEIEQVAAIPFATLGVRINDGPEQIFVLGSDSGSERLWLSSARIAINVRKGRIVQTAGFGTDLSASSSSITSEDWRTAHTYSWTADYKELGIYSAAINCRVEPVRPELIVILSQSFNTLRVDETCRSETLNWSFTNSYWVSLESSRVWRSIQHPHPKGPSIMIELLRPPETQD